MKTNFVLIGLLAGLVACTNSAIHPDATVIRLNGSDWFVRAMEAPNTWQAGPNNGSTVGLIVRPELYVQNVSAIEKVSGCKVLAASVTNINGYTMAAVDC